MEKTMFPFSRPDSDAEDSASGVTDEQDLFLGTLRARLQHNSAQLPENFAALLETFTELRLNYERGRIDTDTYADELAKLTVTDTRDVRWTLGATSHRWFRQLENGSWAQADPPRIERTAEDGPQPPAPRATDPSPGPLGGPLGPPEGPEMLDDLDEADGELPSPFTPHPDADGPQPRQR